MICAWVQERLLLYLAGELDPSQTARLLRHLERCPACATTAEKLSETAGQVEAALPTTIQAPATLDARVMQAVRSLPAPRRSWTARLPRQRLLHRLTLASATLSLMAVSFFTGRWDANRHRPETVAMTPATLDLAQLGAAHRLLLQMPAPGIKANQPAKLQGELASHLPFPLAIVELPADGLRLTGGSQTTIQGVPVAALRYDWHGQRVSIFQVDARQLSPAALRQAVFQSDSYLVRKTGDLTYVTWPFGRTQCVMVAQSVPMHLLFRLACHTSEKLERT